MSKFNMSCDICLENCKIKFTIFGFSNVFTGKISVKMAHYFLLLYYTIKEFVLTRNSIENFLEFLQYALS